jgi:hypothetical protein
MIESRSSQAASLSLNPHASRTDNLQTAFLSDQVLTRMGPAGSPDKRHPRRSSTAPGMARWAPVRQEAASLLRVPVRQRFQGPPPATCPPDGVLKQVKYRPPRPPGHEWGLAHAHPRLSGSSVIRAGQAGQGTAGRLGRRSSLPHRSVSGRSLVLLQPPSASRPWYIDLPHDTLAQLFAFLTERLYILRQSPVTVTHRRFFYTSGSRLPQAGRLAPATPSASGTSIAASAGATTTIGTLCRSPSTARRFVSR